jgi:hypothetical protein
MASLTRYFVCTIPYVVLSISIVMSTADAAPRSKKLSTEAALARNYVFASCLIDKYSGSPLASEAEVWAGGLVEHGNIAADLYSELAQLAQTLAPTPQVSKNGTPMLMESCMALYNNPTLHEKIDRILKR